MRSIFLFCFFLKIIIILFPRDRNRRKTFSDGRDSSLVFLTTLKLCIPSKKKEVAVLVAHWPLGRITGDGYVRDIATITQKGG